MNYGETIKQKVISLHAAHPEYTTRDIYTELGCSQATVYHVAKDCGLKLPKPSVKTADAVQRGYAAMRLGLSVEDMERAASKREAWA